MAGGCTVAASRSSAHLIKRAEMARRLGLSRASVTKACRPGGRLERACQGSAVNVLHPAARKWLALRAAARAEAPPHESDAIPVDGADADAPELAEPVPVPELSPWQLGADLAELEQPLTALTERYGSAEAFAGWVRCRKMLEDARRAEMLRERVAGRLVARTTVVRMIDHVDVAFRLLLTDAPRTVATRLGCPDTAAATALIRDVMSQHLEASRSHMVAALEADDPMAPLMEAAA
jgi:hypothetical protein